MTKSAASKAWQSLKDRPHVDTVVGCVRAYGRDLAANEWRHMKHPESWLRQRKWEGFLPSAPESQTKPEDAPVLEGDHALIAEEFGIAIYNGWFAGCEILRAPFRIIVDKPFKRNWIENNFGQRLRRIFKVDQLIIEVKPEAKAA